MRSAVDPVELLGRLGSRRGAGLIAAEERIAPLERVEELAVPRGHERERDEVLGRSRTPNASVSPSAAKRGQPSTSSIPSTAFDGMRGFSAEGSLGSTLTMVRHLTLTGVPAMSIAVVHRSQAT